jgi:anti-anti-sigma factor
MMGFEMTRDGAQARVTLRANLTATEVPELQPALKEEIAAGVCDFVFDLSQTVSLDSTGIGLLIAANNSLAPMQGAIRLVNVSPDIMKLLQSMRLVDRLHATATGGEVPHG